MRYIGLDPSTRTIIQIDGNKSAYVNVKSFGASGLDRYFDASIAGVNETGNSIFINNIDDYFEFEEDFFVNNREIIAFVSANTSSPSVAEYGGIFGNPATLPVGAIFNNNLATAKNVEYFIFPYNVQTGRFSPYKIQVTQSGIIVDPRVGFDEENYIRITFTRSSSNWVPVIYRRYDGRVDFLGVIGNNALQTSSSVTFFDRGSTQIPSWDQALIAEDNNAFLPEFLTPQISLTGPDGGPVGNALVGKKRLKIIAKSKATGVLELVDADNPTANLSSFAGAGYTVKFKFDDTTPIQDAIEYAKLNNVKDVFFPTGTFNVSHLKLYSSANASAYSGIVLRGTGQSSIIKKLPSAVNAENEFGIVGVLGTGVTNRIDGISIVNLAFDGNKSESIAVRSPTNDIYGISSKYQDSIALEFADAVSVQNCIFYNGAGSAIYALNTEKLNISNCRIFQLSKPYEPNVPPVKIRETEKIVAQGNLFENCSGVVEFTGIDVSVINNNIINNCGDTGLRLQASDNWNAQGNLTYNSSGSIIQTVDLYQNEYSRASLAVKKGVVMPVTYFTVTDNNLPVEIASQTISARVYPLNSDFNVNLSADPKYLQVVESAPQLEAGIFAVTAPVDDIISGVGGSNQSKYIQGTNSYDLINASDPILTNRSYGYAYRITATARLGSFPISKITSNGTDTQRLRIYLSNSSDFLQLLFFGGGNISNDQITTSNVRTSNTLLSNWEDGISRTVVDVNAENSYIIIETPGGVADKFVDSTSSYATRSGLLKLVKNNYFIADGNIYVSD